jgi:hypothetical protein
MPHLCAVAAERYLVVGGPRLVDCLRSAFLQVPDFLRQPDKDEGR